VKYYNLRGRAKDRYVCSKKDEGQGGENTRIGVPRSGGSYEKKKSNSCNRGCVEFYESFRIGGLEVGSYLPCPQNQ